MQHEWRWWSEESSSVLKTLLLTICALDNPSQPLWKQQDSFQWHSSEHFVWLCYVSTHTSRSSRILLLCQAPGSRSHCNCRLFSPPAPRVAFKREKSFFVPEIPQIIFPFFPLVTLCRRAKLADWLRLGGFCESERLISSAICWAENFFGTRELRKPEPATLLNSWFAGFPLDLLVLPHTNHIQYKIYWEKHKCKELENIQSWVIQLAPAFPRPPSSPTRAEHYCQAGFWFDCIWFAFPRVLATLCDKAHLLTYCWQNLLQQTQILTDKNRIWIQSMFFLD